MLESQIIGGNATTAVARLGEGGWIAVSKQIAEEHHVGVGGTLTLPTPTGEARFRIAATTTNLAWSPGRDLHEHRRLQPLLGHHAPTALGVELTPGASVASERERDRARAGGRERPGSRDRRTRGKRASTR